MKFKKKIIKVFWIDAVAYNYKFFRGLTLPQKITVGELVKEENNYIFIKNPKYYIYNKKEKIYIPQGDLKHTFFAIPKGMIKKIRK